MYSYLILTLFAVLSLSSPLPCDESHADSPSLTCTDNQTHSLTPSPSSNRSVALTPINADASNGPFTGGIATYFYQNGNPGACGWYSSDSAIICAMDQARFGTSGPASPFCGRQVRIINLNNGCTATVTIADDCPTCENENSIDLSVGAFQALEPDLSVGEFPISWEYV